MNGRRAILKSVLAAVCMVAIAVVVAAAAAAAAPSQSPGQPSTAAGSSGQPPATAQTAVPAGADYVPGQVLVKYKAGVTAAGARADAANSDAAVRDQITGPAVPGGRLVVVHSDTLSTTRLIAAYEADPKVEYAEPDYVVHALGTPNDPRFDELWGMQQIYAPGAWSVSTGSSTVVIADIDTGVDYTHPDLAANMWHNPGEVGGTAGVDDDHNGYIDDFYGINVTANGNYPGNPMDDEGHGTHTAGTMAAAGNNVAGVVGVCWTAKVMACKFLAADGYGPTSDAIKCINYIVWEKQHGVNVVAANNSWGNSVYNVSLYYAIMAAGDAGIVFVCAAGNDGVNTDSTPTYPAALNCWNIISVAATDSHDHLAAFSNHGPTSVDIAAPGVDILSTVPAFRDASRYASFDGTSMAAPHATGAIALCAAAFPADTTAQRMNRVLLSVDDVAPLHGKVSSGGRLDVRRALTGVAPSDADIPGLPTDLTSVGGALDSSDDVDDVYHFFLKAGTVVNARITTGGSADLALYLFGPHATTVGDKGVALASATGGAYPRALTYSVATTGTYYLDACAVSGSGGYDLACSTGLDEIPGVTLPPSPTIPYLDFSSHTVNVYAAPLGYGQTLSASIASPPSGSDFALRLFDPSAFSVWISTPLVTVREGGYPRNLTYSAWSSGTYYLANLGWAGQGWYTFTWSIAGPGDNDISGAGAIPGSGYSGTISSSEDLDDVYSIQVPPAETVNLSVAGDSGTKYDVYVFDSSATTVEGHQGAVVSATGTTYPQSVTFTAPPSPFPFSKTYYVDVHAVTGAGAYTLTYSTLYDTTAPVTTAAGLRTSPTDWQNIAQAVTLGATDSGGSGLARTDYTLDGVQHAYSGAFTVSGSGNHAVSYWSTDNAGNEEAHHTGYVNIDTTAPRTEAGGLQETANSGWTNTPVDVTLTSTDDQSGIDRILFTVDEDEYDYRGPYTVSEPGSHEVTYWAVDRVGNEETRRVGYVNIDTQPPDITPPTLSPEPNAAGWNDGDVVVTINAKDGGGSGVQKTQYAVHGSEEWQDTHDHDQFTVPGPPDHRGDGEWVYDYRAFDNAGNRSDVGTATVNIDTDAPSTSDDYNGVPRRYVSISLTAVDATSGVAATWYRIDGGAWQSGTTFTLKLRTRHKAKGLSKGAHTVEYYSRDNAGNVEIEIKSCVVELWP